MTAALRLRVLPRFPARITGQDGVKVTRENPNSTDLTVSLDFENLGDIAGIPDPSKNYFAMWDEETGSYVRILFQSMFDSAGVSAGYPTRVAAEVTSILPTIHAVELYGDTTVGDGLGGLYIDSNNGSPDTFVSGDGRTWYRAEDVGEDRLTDDAKALFATAAQGALADSAMQPAEYDPQGIGDDAFAFVNMTGTVQTAQIANDAATFDKLGTDVKASANVLITVGTGGNFSTINAALVVASKLINRPYTPFGFSVEISLLTGFVMAEQVVVERLDLSFITITSVDAEVTINRASLTTLVDGGSDSDYPAFSGLRGGKLPEIQVLFNMDATGAAAGRTFVYVRDVGSQAIIGAGKGCKNAGARGVEARYQATVHCVDAIFTNAGNRALYALHQGRIFAQGANCDDCQGDVGVYALMDGRIFFTLGTAKNKANSGPAIWANRGGVIIASNANADDCLNTDMAQAAVYATDGGRVVFDSGSAIDSLCNGVAAGYGGQIAARSSTVTGAAQDAFYAFDGGRIDANLSVASAAARFGYYASDSGEVNARSGTATGCLKGAQADWAGRVNVRSATLTGATSQGVSANRGGYINIGLGNAQRGGSPAATDIVVATNGKIDAAGATGGLSQAANTITSAGLINQ
ncbi:hypothetical protein E5S70_17710 [Ensifer adhaerens]|uniref:hypothetical protein n=1 Tax=Ensifer canadensis TaxID=555315 RepID=UPI0014901C11|nr:hypothetical protein [Ensifer canadensis]NOV17889.1 hypothetical protein [Ensifer canadensis]